MEIFNSNRKGHLFAAAIAGLFCFSLGLALNQKFLMKMGFVCFLWEVAATNDMDHNSRKISGRWLKRLWVLYWWPYQKIIVHRSKWSHSLLIGTPLKALYIAWPYWLWLLHHNWPTIQQFNLATAIAFVAQVAISLLTLLVDQVVALATGPVDWFWNVVAQISAVATATMSWSWLPAGAVLADAVHLSKDGYSVHSMLFGRKK